MLLRLTRFLKIFSCFSIYGSHGSMFLLEFKSGTPT